MATMPAIVSKGTRASSASSSARKGAVPKGIKSKVFYPVMGEKLYLAQDLDVSTLGRKYHCFSTHGIIEYHALCDDFGPMNLVSVVKFIRLLEEESEKKAPAVSLVYVADQGKRGLSNAVFLMGAFLMLKHNKSAREVMETFKNLDTSLIEKFRDATFSHPDFELTLEDCWRGIQKGMQDGWVQYPTSSPEQWGDINIDEYDHYENPLNGDLHEVVPGKFVAFKGPKDLEGREFRDDLEGYRHFSPLYYIEIFNELGVTDIVRLNEPEYDANNFVDEGFAHHDLEFEDCTSPPDHIVAAFLRIADAAPGLVAVHCKAGLGRTGTLIARYLMRTHGFSARECMGWLRVMRPGCVIGEQQHYLCVVDGSAPPPAPTVAMPGNPPPARPPSLSAASLAAQVASGMRRRSVARNSLDDDGGEAGRGSGLGLGSGVLPPLRP